MDYYQRKHESNMEMADCVVWLVTAPFKFLINRPWLVALFCVLGLIGTIFTFATWAVSLGKEYFQ